MKRKKRYFKRWLEKTLITINVLIFCFFAMLEDFTKQGFLILLILLTIFIINALLISKYGRLLKEEN